MNGTIFDIKEMAVHDGPGIRTTIFFKGCPLRCIWCHNPEGLSAKPQLMYKHNNCKNCGKCKQKCNHPDCQPFDRCLHICPENCLTVTGREVTAKDLASEIIPSAQVLGDGFGGFTFSGGEPLMQSEFLLELIEELKGFHLCIETSGYASSETFKKVIEKLDLVIMDIKLADNELHKKYTGVSNTQILENFEILKNSGKPYIIRTPLISAITDTKENLLAIEKIIGNSTWEKLPENEVAGAKYKMLEMEFPLEKEKAKRN
ncbi:MAG: glycyl-radical enzyme activating protein [Ruminococcaceae bacterium]|nr:glycyl-radical enzyme activating protein [Oscillospiraceae bacterium]